MMTAKLNPEFVKATFEAEGYRLLNDYENAHKPIAFICPKGHDHRISWTSFQQGGRCAYCAGKAVKPETVWAAFEVEGYVLLGEYPEKSSKPIPFICPKGHRHQMSWSHFQRGGRCAYCTRHIVKPETVVAGFAAAGYTLLGEYKKSSEPISFICPQGHRHQISWNTFQTGVRCAYCARRAVKPETVRAAFEAEGYVMLGEYKKATRPISFICPQGHRHQMSWDNFSHGKRCNKCGGSGYSTGKPGRLYYIRFDFGQAKHLWKIGITNRTIAERLSAEKTPYVVLSDELWADGRIARDREKAILKAHKAHLYKGPILLNSGNTECFTIDVLGRDRKHKSKRSVPTTQLSIPIAMAV
jgi:ribosomal protein S27E